MIRRRIRVNVARLDIRWVTGHHRYPLNEGTDVLARPAWRHCRGDQDVGGDEYSRRAAGTAEAFAAEYGRVG